MLCGVSYNRVVHSKFKQKIRQLVIIATPWDFVEQNKAGTEKIHCMKCCFYQVQVEAKLNFGDRRIGVASYVGSIN